MTVVGSVVPQECGQRLEVPAWPAPTGLFGAVDERDCLGAKGAFRFSAPFVEWLAWGACPRSNCPRGAVTGGHGHRSPTPAAGPASNLRSAARRSLRNWDSLREQDPPQSRSGPPPGGDDAAGQRFRTEREKPGAGRRRWRGRRHDGDDGVWPAASFGLLVDAPETFSEEDETSRRR
jgi:hypothetical protein